MSTRHFASHRGARATSRFVVRWSTRRVTRQIAVSQYVSDHVDGPSTVVLSGVRPDPGRVRAGQRQPVVLVAQRLEREKGTDIALRGFARSGLPGQGWRMQVAGSGSLLGELQSLARELGVERAVDFLGHRTDVWDLMRSAAVLLAPRADEAYGLSVVEAMARGLPVVAAGSGAHLETVGSVPGAALYHPAEPDDAAQLLRTLASSERERDVYGERLQAVQRERFTVAEQARRTEVVYRELL